MENFVRRLFNDADFRREFLANPALAIANSGLPEHERAAARRLSGHLAMAVGSPAGAKGSTPVAEALVWY